MKQSPKDRKIPATQLKPKENIPKTKDELSKTTMVQGQKTKTKLHRPCKTNQIGNNAILLAGKNCHGINKEKTNVVIWFCC